MPTAAHAQEAHLRALCANGFALLGRRYRMLVPRRKKKHWQIVFFATSGPGLTHISVATVREWHVPSAHNTSMTVPKYASRFDLAFSETDRTVQLPDAACITVVEDVVSAETGEVRVLCCGNNAAADQFPAAVGSCT